MILLLTFAMVSLYHPRSLSEKTGPPRRITGRYLKIKHLAISKWQLARKGKTNIALTPLPLGCWEEFRLK